MANKKQIFKTKRGLEISGSSKHPEVKTLWLYALKLTSDYYGHDGGVDN